MARSVAFASRSVALVPRRHHIMGCSHQPRALLRALRRPGGVRRTPERAARVSRRGPLQRRRAHGLLGATATQHLGVRLRAAAAEPVDSGLRSQTDLLIRPCQFLGVHAGHPGCAQYLAAQHFRRLFRHWLCGHDQHPQRTGY